MILVPGFWFYVFFFGQKEHIFAALPDVARGVIMASNVGVVNFCFQPVC